VWACSLPFRTKNWAIVFHKNRIEIKFGLKLRTAISDVNESKMGFQENQKIFFLKLVKIAKDSDQDLLI
jgi:hypothetical protein